MGVPFARFTSTRHGTIFRTSDGLQGYYARVLRLRGDEMLASFVASQAIESPDSHPELARSTDGGLAWTAARPVDSAHLSPGHATETGFISMTPDGRLFCLGARWPLDPADPSRPLVHPQTLGMADNEPVLRVSSDGGRTWTPPRMLARPYPTPLELPTGVTALADGTLLLSCSTWREWDGQCPYGHRVTSMRSTDGGATWTGPIDIFHDASDRVGFWEARIAQLSEKVLLATCWAHDWQADQDVPNHFAFSRDAGRTWEPPRASPVMGQTAWPLRLADGRVFFIYNHRRPPVGVRAQLVDVAGGRWETVHDAEVWSPEDRRTGNIKRGEYEVTNFQFGAPSAILLSDDTVFCVYWCVVQGRAGINWTLCRLER